MKQKKSAGRALLSSVLALVLCCTSFLGTTFAWFTDSASTGVNRIVSGTLDVELYHGLDVTAPKVTTDTKLFDSVTYWEPGVVSYENLTVENAGNLALQYDFAVNFENASKTAGGKTLADALSVGLVKGGIDTTLTREQVVDSVTEWTNLKNIHEVGKLEPGQTATYGIVICWQPSGADNQFNVNNGLTIDLGVILSATQVTHEFDSFDDQYDASQNTVIASSAEDIQDALANGYSRIVLDNDITVDADTEYMSPDNNSLFYFRDMDVTIDLNGHDIIADDDALLDGKSNGTALFLVHYSTLNIVGDGSIITENKAIPVYGWAHSEINIYGGNFISNASERNESAVYVNNPNVVINVYGGNYSENAYDFNAHDSKCGNTPVIILHEGVEFNRFLKNGTTDVIASDMNAGRIVLAEGCYLKETVVDGETVYEVTAKEEDTGYVGSYGDIIDAMIDGTGGDFVLTDDLTADDMIYFGVGSTASLDLNGQTITAGNQGQYLLASPPGSTLILSGDGVVNAGKGFFASGENARIIIDGGTYNTSVSGTLNNVKHTSLVQGGSMVINDGTFTTNVEDAVLFWATSNGRLEINGGFFENTADDTPDLLGVGTNGSNTNRIIIKGGTFVNYNPLNDQMTYTGAWPAAGEAAFGGPWILIPGDYQVVSETQSNGDIWYSVVPR